MILVAGGTGTLGTQVVRLLTGRGQTVRVLTRDPARAAHLPGTVQALTGDLRDPAAMAAAVRGCQRVISAVHGFVGPGKPSPESIDRDANRALIQAAAAAGVEHMVLVSVLGAAPDHPMSLHRAKHAAEQALQAAGVQWTIIRPAAYLETWIATIGAKLAGNGQALVFGPGRNPVNFVSAHDVAAAVDLAVHDHSLRGQILEVAGPETLTFTQLAERLITASGQPGRTRHIPLAMLRAMSVLARPVSPVFARQAQAAVVMSTTDMAVDVAAIRDRFPTIPATTLDEVIRRQPPLEGRAPEPRPQAAAASRLRQPRRRSHRQAPRADCADRPPAKGPSTAAPPGLKRARRCHANGPRRGAVREPFALVPWTLDGACPGSGGQAGSDSERADATALRWWWWFTLDAGGGSAAGMDNSRPLVVVTYTSRATQEGATCAVLTAALSRALRRAPLCR